MSGHAYVEDVSPSTMVHDTYGSTGVDADAVLIAQPITNAQGKVVGVWSNRFSWPVARQLVLDQLQRAYARGAKTENVNVVNSQGVVIASDTPSDTLKQNIASSAETKKALAGDADGSALLPNIDDHSKTDVAGWHRTTGSASFKSLGWAVMANQASSEALKPASSLAHKTILIALLSMLAIAAVAFF